MQTEQKSGDITDLAPPCITRAKRFHTHVKDHVVDVIRSSVDYRNQNNQARTENNVDHNDDDRFYIALFSALEQTRCAFVACASE